MSKREKVTAVILLLAAAICELYGLKIYHGGSGTGFFITWIVLGLIFAALALCVKLSVWKKLHRTVKIILCTLLCIALLIFMFVEGCIISHFGDRGEDGLDYIVVLGAQVYESGPGPMLALRLDAAAEYLKNNPDTLCIVSGGQGYNEPYPEAIGMQAYLLAKGIEPERIITEPQSQNTKENLIFSQSIIADENASVGLVTNNFHVFRAVQTAGKLGYKNVCGIAAGTTLGFLPNNLLREFFGVLKYNLVG